MRDVTQTIAAINKKPNRMDFHGIPPAPSLESFDSIFAASSKASD